MFVTRQRQAITCSSPVAAAASSPSNSGFSSPLASRHAVPAASALSIVPRPIFPGRSLPVAPTSNSYQQMPSAAATTNVDGLPGTIAGNVSTLKLVVNGEKENDTPLPLKKGEVGKVPPSSTAEKRTRLQERIAASLSGIKELELLREKHRQMIEEVRNHLRTPFKPANLVDNKQKRSSTIPAGIISVVIQESELRTPSPTQSLSSFSNTNEFGSNVSHRSSLSMDSGCVSVCTSDSTTTMVSHRSALSADAADMALVANCGNLKPSPLKALSTGSLTMSRPGRSFTPTTDVSEDEGYCHEALLSSSSNFVNDTNNNDSHSRTDANAHAVAAATLRSQSLHCNRSTSVTAGAGTDSPLSSSLLDVSRTGDDTQQLPAIVVRMRNKRNGMYANAASRPRSLYTNFVEAELIDRRPRVLRAGSVQYKFPSPLHALAMQSRDCLVLPELEADNSSGSDENGNGPTRPATMLSHSFSMQRPAPPAAALSTTKRSNSTILFRANRVFVQPLSPVLDRKEPNNSSDEQQSEASFEHQKTVIGARKPMSKLGYTRSSDTDFAAQYAEKRFSLANSGGYCQTQILTSPRPTTAVSVSVKHPQRQLSERPKSMAIYALPSLSGTEANYAASLRIGALSPTQTYTWEDVKKVLDPNFRRNGIQALINGGSNDQSSRIFSTVAASASPVTCASMFSIDTSSSASSNNSSPFNNRRLLRQQQHGAPATILDPADRAAAGKVYMPGSAHSTPPLSVKGLLPDASSRTEHIIVCRSVSSQSSDSIKSSRKREKTWHESGQL